MYRCTIFRVNNIHREGYSDRVSFTEYALVEVYGYSIQMANDMKVIVSSNDIYLRFKNSKLDSSEI